MSGNYEPKYNVTDIEFDLDDDEHMTITMI